MVKHLNETVFQSGVHTLWSSEAMHNTSYKHVNMIIEKTRTVEGETVLTMKWKLAYVT